jgi:Phage Mu protein F like protein.
MNKYLLGFDEINRLDFEAELEELFESLYTVMYDAYIRGFGDEEPKEDLIELLIFFKYDGKDPFDLLEEAYKDKDTVRIKTIFDNEYHRMFNAGAYDYGKEHCETKKWVTMNDFKVRDTHNYLEGIEVPVDAEFITFDGDAALYPGGFSNASNNVNCRCVLEYK